MPLTTYNHVSIPSFMYGTAWKKEATTGLVVQAVETGFTAIDTANQLVHYDEARVGEALLQLAKQGITRDKLFVQTKFTPIDGQDHRLPYDARASITTQVQQSFASSLAHLDTDYLDSYVLHGPYSRRGLGSEDWDVWAAIESHYDAGKAKMIGVSNIMAEQLTLLCAKARHKPMVVQNRCYAAFGWDKEVREICQANQIIYQGFSLLTANREVFRDQAIRTMAAKYQTGLAQIVFRFSQQVGMLPLTGTTNPQHMKEDLECERFNLLPEEIAQIETIGL
ncbi:MAG: aldo/keto reductase [Nitrospira sp.]|nr:aldo/keto reductase [Nitrospira sp.]MDH4244334.1 aldo/keto reductase [Nitrospira sp.]MDH4357849.1 aldo/keto reductase [Nitrospira sp.]MDH5318290.1 aldo/keto reductase [Nitrospira sp.]